VFGFTLVVNNGFVSSTAALVTVNVTDQANDIVTITLVEYRLGQQRLTVNATSSILDGTPVLTLAGFGPNNAGVTMTTTGGGIYTLILTGVPQPASVTVRSSFGGSAISPVTRLRQ
jgi:hypothetical protein